MKLENLDMGKILKTKKNKTKNNKKSLFEKLFKISKLKKPNTVAVIYLRNNGIAEPMEVEVEKGFFNINNRTYHADRECIYTVTKERKPLAIIKEWDLTPIGTMKWDEKSIQEKCAELQDHTIRGIRNAELVRMGDKDKVKVNTKAAVGIIILIIVVVAVIYGYK